MNCDQMEELISDLIDGELSEQVRDGVEQQDHDPGAQRLVGVNCSGLEGGMQRAKQE